MDDPRSEPPRLRAGDNGRRVDNFDPGPVPPPTLERGGSAWDEAPLPLGHEGQLPVFPVEALPPTVSRMVAALAEFTQTPVDLAGCLALAVLAASAGGRADVAIRGSWREPLNLFVVVAMPPGSRKSAVFTEMTAPLLDAEQTITADALPVISEARTQRAIADKRAEQLAERAAKATGADAADVRRQAVEAKENAEAIRVPSTPRLVADDITPEAAGSLLAEQDGRLAILSAEGGIFATIAGRYNGGVPSLDVFLKGHAGDMLRVDRKGRPPEHVDRPALTIGLAVQPDVLRAIADLPGFRGRGLLARLLFAVPSSNVGHRKIGAAPVPADLRTAYATTMTTVTLTLRARTDPAVLTLDPGATRALLDHEARIEPRLRPEVGDLGHVADWASKLVGTTARLAGLVHLGTHLTDGWGRPVDEATMRQAIALADYFAGHALGAFDLMGADPAVEDARAVLAWVRRNACATFSRRDLFRGLASRRFVKVTDLDPPLALLVGHGYIREQPRPTGGSVGRPPAPVYEVNPRAALNDRTDTTDTIRRSVSSVSSVTRSADR